MKVALALIKKEFLQIKRDYSSILIAFILPLIILILYRYSINLDTVKITLGIKNDDLNPKISTLINSFDKNKYIKADFYNNRKSLLKDLKNGKIKGGVVIPNDFTGKLLRKEIADIFVVVDGSETNLANYVQNYSIQILNNWFYNSEFKNNQVPALINLEERYWFNQNIDSHQFILPGSLAVTMNLIGMLLTALVISREWERGTIEALYSTKIKRIEFVISKYFPYFVLGILSYILNILICIFIFKINFRGNFLILVLVGGLYLFCCLGIGLLISSNYKEQFSSSQVALSFGLLPAMLLSGLIYPISSMPKIFQILTTILPPRYFIIFIQSEFMAGTIKEIVLLNSFFLGILGVILFLLVLKNINLRLENG